MIDSFYERVLTPEEIERVLTDTREEAEGPKGEETRSLILWFRRRYPTPLDRIRYSRRKYHEAKRFQGILKAPR